MSSKQQLADQAATLGYHNRAHRAHQFDDSDRARARRKRLLGRLTPEDPCCVVECGYCREHVMAVRKRYFDTPEQLHRHQPEGATLPKQPYSINESGATP